MVTGLHEINLPGKINPKLVNTNLKSHTCVRKSGIG